MGIADEESVSDICRCFSAISDEYSRLVQNIDFFKSCENEVINNVKETADNYLQSEKAAAVISILNSVLVVITERNTYLEQKLAEIKGFLNCKIHYLPCGPQTHTFKYIGGDSPWNFWLQDTTIDIKLLHKTLLEKYENNELKKLWSLPDVNDYICYIERKKVFRGKVLRLLEENRVKLIDVDTSCVKRIHQGNLYEIDTTTCKVHALAVNCCLSKDFEDEKIWSADLGEIFTNVLANGTLFLDICKQLNDGPVFLVNVRVTGEDENCVSMQEWICGRIIPELRNMCDKGLTPLADYLSPRAVDAFFQQYTTEELNSKSHLCEENTFINGDSSVCQCNPLNTCNSLLDESQLLNSYKIDSSQQKLKTSDLPGLLDSSDSLFLKGNISDSKIIFSENISEESTDKYVVFTEGSKDSNSCVSITQMPEEGALPEEKFTISECESAQKSMMTDVVLENKNTVGLLDVCKNLKQMSNDTKTNGDKTEVDSGKYVQHNMVNKVQSMCQSQGMNISYLTAPYPPFMHSNPSGFSVAPFYNNQQYPCAPVHVSTVPLFHSMVVPSNSNVEKNSSNHIPYRNQLSAYKVKIPHYPVWSDSIHLTEGIGYVTKENVDSPLFNSSVNLKESSSRRMLSESKNKTYTFHNSTAGSSVTLPATSGTSYVKECDNRQNYTDIFHNQKAVPSAGFKTCTQDYKKANSSSDSGINNYHVNLRKPRTLLKEGGKLKVILSYIISPWKFYIHFPNENNTYIDKLKEEMTNYYSANVVYGFPSYPWSKLKEILGKYCACQWNSYWYRVEVLNWNDAGNVRVFFVDYGNEESVLLSALRPLFVQFTEYNMMAQHCHLADVFPINSEDNCWPESAKQFFSSLIDCETPCTVIVISSRNDYVSNSLGVILFNDNDGTSVNEIMVKEGVAMTQNRTLKGHINEHSKEGIKFSDGFQVINRQHNDYIDQNISWKKSRPQAKHSYCTYSVYEKDTDDADVAVTGYKAQNEMHICKFYAHNGYCWKRVCRKEHSFLNEVGVTTDKVLVYNEAFTLLDLPDVGQVLVIKVTAVFSLSHFFVQMQENLSGCLRNEENEMETLSSLSEFINRSTNVKSLKHLTAQPNYSQLVLARSEDGIWYRAQVMEMCENDKEYEVLYVDYGTVENVSLDNLREIEPRYLHLPFQAIQCDLANIKLLEENSVSEKAADMFRDAFVGHDLKAEVINRYSQYNCLSLKLFCNKTGDIGEWLYSKGLCELTQNVKYESKYIV